MPPSKQPKAWLKAYGYMPAHPAVARLVRGIWPSSPVPSLKDGRAFFPHPRHPAQRHRDSTAPKAFPSNPVLLRPFIGPTGWYGETEQ